MFPKAGQTF